MSIKVEQRLLDILSDGWKSRTQIARELGRPNGLASHDIAELNRLWSIGKVERVIRQYHGVQTRWEYRKVQS